MRLFLSLLFSLFSCILSSQQPEVKVSQLQPLPSIPPSFWQVDSLERTSLLKRAYGDKATGQFLKKMHTLYKRHLEQGFYQKELEAMQHYAHAGQKAQENAVLDPFSEAKESASFDAHIDRFFKALNALIGERNQKLASIAQKAHCSESDRLKIQQNQCLPFSAQEVALLRTLMATRYLKECRSNLEEKTHRSLIECFLKKSFFTRALEQNLLKLEEANYLHLLAEYECCNKAIHYLKLKDGDLNLTRALQQLEILMPQLIARNSCEMFYRQWSALLATESGPCARQIEAILEKSEQERLALEQTIPFPISFL